jgi:hypothetical protein
MATAAAQIDLLDYERKRRSPWVTFMRRLVFEKRLGFAGAIIVVIFIIMAAASPILATSEIRRRANPQ